MSPPINNHLDQHFEFLDVEMEIRNNRILHMQSYKNQVMIQNQNFVKFYQMLLTQDQILSRISVY